MRLRKDDSNAAIAAKSCLAIRRVWLTVNPLPPRAAFTFSNPRGVPMKAGTLEEFGTLKAMAPLHVLIVSRSRNDVELILHELREPGLHLDHTLAENQQQFRRALLQENFDAILSDYRLPLRETGRDIPFLLVTGTRGEEAAVECIKQGATDYILKDRPTTLGRVLREISDQVKKRKASG